jgi:hypothetical protein
LLTRSPVGRSPRSAARGVRPAVAAILGGLLAGLGAAGAWSTVASAAQPSWSQTVALVRCASVGSPHVVFPAADPFHASGQGAILWSGNPADCSPAEAAAGAAVGIAPFEPDHTLGAPQPLPAAAAPALTELNAVTSTGNGRIVLAGGIGPTAGAAGGLSQGPASGPFTIAARLGGPSSPVAVTSSYLGDVAIASVSTGNRVELRLERRDAPRFGPPIVLSSRPAAISALAVNLDYRGDAVVAWAAKGAIFVRVRASTGVLLPIQRVASSPLAPRLETLISDDNRAIVAWESDRTAVGSATRITSTYLDISVPGIHFTGPRLLERFVDPPGFAPPATGLQLVRLAYEGVIVGWTGLLDGHFVVRTAPVSVTARRPTTTVSDPNSDAMLADMATGPKGEVIALWTTAPRTGNPAQAAARILSARGVSEASGVTRFDPPQVVSGPGDLLAPRVAIDPVTDVAVAAWREGDTNPGIDYAVREGSAAQAATAGAPGTAKGALRGGRSGLPALPLGLAAVLGLGLILVELRRRTRASARRAVSQLSEGSPPRRRPLRKRVISSLGLARSDT